MPTIKMTPYIPNNKQNIQNENCTESEKIQSEFVPNNQQKIEKESVILNDSLTVKEYIVKLKNGKSPYIGDNGNWFEYNDALMSYVDTGVKSEGQQGERGKDGYTPIKGIDYFDGKDGQNGRDGLSGYTPIKGVDYFDGIDGKDGVDGKDGYTPIKGIDYFDGEKGEKGDPGDKGQPGEQGPQGIQGVKGDTGATGPKGDDGNDYVITSADYQAIADVVEIDINPLFEQKQDMLVSGANIKTINGNNVLGSGNIIIQSGTMPESIILTSEHGYQYSLSVDDSGRLITTLVGGTIESTFDYAYFDSYVFN